MTLNKRKRHKKETLAMEFWRIEFFTTECLWPKAGARTSMKDIVAAYKKWKWKQHKDKTGIRDISHDSFGRLFSKTKKGQAIKRCHMSIRGVVGRGIRGWAIKESTLTAPTKSGRIED